MTIFCLFSGISGTVFEVSTNHGLPNSGRTDLDFELSYELFCTIRVFGGRRGLVHVYVISRSVPMAQKRSWKPYHIFLFLLIFQVTLLKAKFTGALINSYIVYLFFGGWKFQRIFALTIRRDLRGLRLLLLLSWDVWWHYLFKETFRDMFERTVRKVGNDAVAFYFEDQIWTFGHLESYSNKVANHLLKCGFARGDKLFLLMHSSPAYVGIWLGASKIGVCTALLNYNLRKDSLLHCLKAVDARAIVVGSRLKNKFEEVDGQRLFDENRVWYVDEESSTPDSAFTTFTKSTCTWNLALAEAHQTVSLPISQSLSCREHLIYVYTSGTSGLPKAAIITVSRFCLMVDGCRHPFGISGSDILYTALPLYHSMAGICGIGQALLHGTPVAIRSKFSASHFWDDCIKYRCTVVQYIGEICRYLIAQPPKLTDTQHHVRLAFGNGLRRDTWIEFQRRFNVPNIMELYGATESNASVINTDNTVGAVGFLPQTMPWAYPVRLIKTDPTTEEPVRDPDTGLCVECKPFEPGQLIGRINNKHPMRNFDGYLNKQASSKRLLRDAFKKGDIWFATGDLLYSDELGYLYFSDRLGDTFRWHGENVSTAEVEAVLSKPRKELMMTVYGVPVPNTEGKAGMVAICLDLAKMSEADEAALIASLQDACFEHLPIYARPIFIRLCTELAMTSTYKPCKYEMVKRGYNPTGTNDHIYFLDPATHSYRLLDKELFDKIVAGAVRL
ncbi:unnamed protein product [Calicophoron daubneyi]|uniref:Very long-chain fatty acid transport protein n=1 Tax=Calicophoron daubneyi TaxID=300641 RepID=A0AAV2T9B0_CALDB